MTVLVAVLRTEKSRSKTETRKEMTKITTGKRGWLHSGGWGAVEDSRLWSYLFLK